MWSFILIVSMLFFAASGMFYSAAATLTQGNRFAYDVCGLGGIFCDHPEWLMFAGVATLFVAFFVRLLAPR